MAKRTADTAAAARPMSLGPDVAERLSDQVSSQSGASTEISTETFRGQVAEAAYYLAERRGFAPGGEVEDWLVAEAQIRTRLGIGSRPD